ncbi:hypothetical protein B0H14DRAFT_2493470 [Mycena olivaceomarginata]|nr:hypothetical protein B0H14DRAFT_2493470 [Mycena olivaceomarginata]
MSSKAIAAASTHFLQFRLQYSSLALLYYDFALTFPKEVKYIWKERFRLSTALYIGCRYALVANVLYLLAIAHRLGSTCDSWYKIIGALSILGRASVIAVFSMRTYAVYGKNKWILAYMGTVGLACIALDITHVPGMRCVGSSSLPMSPEMLSILMVIFESSSAFLTAVRCVIAFRSGGGLKNQRQGLMFILFEQGVLYFCTISIFTTAAVILNYRAPVGFFQRLPNAFTLPLSCILTARFILHLREWDAEKVGEMSRVTDISVVEFHAASRSDVISSFVAADDFGVDPVGQTIGIQEELHVAKHLHSASDMASTSVLEPTGNKNQRYQDAV